MNRGTKLLKDSRLKGVSCSKEEIWIVVCKLMRHRQYAVGFMRNMDIQRKSAKLILKDMKMLQLSWIGRLNSVAAKNIFA